MDNPLIPGDVVKVVKYGHLIWLKEEEFEKAEIRQPILGKVDGVIWIDISPHIVGEVGVIDKVSNPQGVPKYSLKGIPEKTAWYDRAQLKRIQPEKETA